MLVQIHTLKGTQEALLTRYFSGLFELSWATPDSASYTGNHPTFGFCTEREEKQEEEGFAL